MSTNGGHDHARQNPDRPPAQPPPPESAPDEEEDDDTDHDTDDAIVAAALPTQPEVANRTVTAPPGAADTVLARDAWGGPIRTGDLVTVDLEVRGVTPGGHLLLCVPGRDRERVASVLEVPPEAAEVLHVATTGRAPPVVRPAVGRPVRVVRAVGLAAASGPVG